MMEMPGETPESLEQKIDRALENDYFDKVSAELGIRALVLIASQVEELVDTIQRLFDEPQQK